MEQAPKPLTYYNGTPPHHDSGPVARLELISKAQEQVLNTLDGMDEKVASEKLAALQPGRYSAGGMQRAKTLINTEIQKRFTRLEEIRKTQESLRAASTQIAE